MTAPNLIFSFRQRFKAEVLEAAGAFRFGEALVQAVMGDSGAGKTSLARWLAGHAKGAQGCLSWDGDNLFDSEAKINVSPQHRRIAYLPQGDALFPHLSVAANIAFGLRQWPAEEREERVAELSALTGVLALLEKKPAALSGGEKRRVALAQALAVRPRLLLLDEPFTGLDRKGREALWAETSAWLAKEKLPTILITHDEAEARAFTNRIFRFEGKRLAVR